MTTKLKKHVGKKYGRLRVLKEIDPIHFDTRKINKGIRRFLVKCDCGSEKGIDGFQLSRKHNPIKSCGCIGKEKKFKTRSTKYYRRLYNIWFSMRNRCANKNNSDYHKYGERGISVCKRWSNFSNFYNDMIDTYSEGMTVERINVNGDYKPSNCTWIKNTDQAKNRRTTVWIEGQCMKDWCKSKGISYSYFSSFKQNKGIKAALLKFK